VPSTGTLSLKTCNRRVVSGSGVGFIRTTACVVAPELMVKCCPSILKPSAVTEIRYLPAGRSPSAVSSSRSTSVPWATIGAKPEVGRVDGHGQASA
jgi:hypothetical protein